MGYPSEILVEQVQDQYQCRQCKGLMEDPVQCSVCKTSYCRSCYQTTQKCSNCKSSNEPQNADPFVVAYIESTQAKCPACYTIMKIKDFNYHFYNCKNSEALQGQEFQGLGNLGLDNLQQVQQNTQPISSFQKETQQIKKRKSNNPFISQDIPEDQFQDRVQQQEEINFSENVQRLEQLIYQNGIDGKQQIVHIYKDLNEIRNHYLKEKDQNSSLDKEVCKIEERIKSLEKTVQNILNQIDYLIQISQNFNKFQGLNTENQDNQPVQSDFIKEKTKLLEDNQKQQELLEMKVSKLQQMVNQQEDVIQKYQQQIQNYNVEYQNQTYSLKKMKEDYDYQLEALSQKIYSILENKDQFGFQSSKSRFFEFSPRDSHNTLKFDSQKKLCQFSKDLTYKTTVLPAQIDQNKQYSVKFKLKKGEQFILGLTNQNKNYERSFTFFSSG